MKGQYPPGMNSTPHGAMQQKLTKAQILAISGFLVGIMLAALDSTIVGTITPTIVAEFGAIQLSAWVFGAYMLAQTTFLPLFGKLSDQFGRKRLYFVGLFIFLIGSVLCGMAQTMEQLIGFRVIQGIGAGALFPIAMSAIGLEFPPHLRGKLQGFFSAVFGFSSLFGPILGSLIGSYTSWRYAFYINVPIVIIAFLLLYRFYHDKAITPPSKVKIDYLGAFTLTGGVGLLLYGFLWAGNHNEWLSWQFWSMTAGAVLLFILFIFIETKAEAPVIPMHLFKQKVLVSSFIGNFLSGVLMFTGIFFIPMFIQGVIGGTIATAGIVLMPFMIGMVLGSSLTGKMIIPLGIRKIALVSMALFCIGYICLSTMSVNTSAWTAILYMAITGVGLGIALVTLIISIQVSIAPQLMGIGSSLAQFFRNLGGVMGINILASIQTFLLFHNSHLGQDSSALSKFGGANGVSKALFSNEEIIPTSILQDLRIAFSDATTSIFMIGIFIAVVGFLTMFMLPVKMTRPSFSPGGGPPQVRKQPGDRVAGGVSKSES